MTLFNTRYDLRGKVALVTGAGSGIGEALVALLHERGVSVVLVDVDHIAIKEAAEAFGDRALAIPADVRDRAAMDAAVSAAVEHFGRLDIVVANAGVAPEAATLRTIDPDDFDRVIDVNLTGVFNTIHPALDHVIRNEGHVVLVSSVAAFIPGPALASYSASKSGVEQLGRALRLELSGTGASAGVVHFGFVQTPFVRPIDEDPVGRELDAMMPWPLSRRITAERAAEVIADGIARRSPTMVASAAWWSYALTRGLANVVLDNGAAMSKTLHRLIRVIEGRAEVQR